MFPFCRYPLSVGQCWGGGSFCTWFAFVSNSSIWFNVGTLSSCYPATSQVYTRRLCVPLSASSPCSNLFLVILPLSVSPCYPPLTLVLLIILFLNTFYIMVYLSFICLFFLRLHLFLFLDLCLRLFRIQSGWQLWHWKWRPLQRNNKWEVMPFVSWGENSRVQMGL